MSIPPLRKVFSPWNLPLPAGKNRSVRLPSPWKLQWLFVRWCGTLICWNHTIMYCNHSFYYRLTSPLLLIALSVAGGGCLFISFKNQGKKIQVLGGKLIVIYDVIYYTLSNSPELPCNFLDNIVTFLLFCIGRRLSQTRKLLCLNFSVNFRLKS